MKSLTLIVSLALTVLSGSVAQVAYDAALRREMSRIGWAASTPPRARN
jgi:hypothetical protein